MSDKVKFTIEFTGENGTLTTPELSMEVPGGLTFPTSAAHRELHYVLANVVDPDITWDVTFHNVERDDPTER